MTEALEDHYCSVSLRWWLTNTRFADDLVIAAEEEETGVLENHLYTTTKYKLEIGPGKTKLMTNNCDELHDDLPSTVTTPANTM